MKIYTGVFMFFSFSPKAMIGGALFLFIIFAFGDQIDAAFQVFLVFLAIAAVIAAIMFVRLINLESKEYKVRVAEGTNKIGCRAFSRRVVDSVNEKLYDAYGHGAHLAHHADGTQDALDVEVFSVSGELMDEAFERADSAYHVVIKMHRQKAVAAFLSVMDVSKRSGSGEVWSGQDASVPGAADQIFACVQKIIDKERVHAAG